MTDPKPHTPLRILLVEDSPDDAELNLRELRRGGFQVASHRVETVDSMIEALREHSWDCVLSDFQLPIFGGFEALRTLQASKQDIPFILVSGAIGEEIAVAAMKAGAHDYVLKGNLARLCPAVERELKEVAVRRQKQQAEQALKESQARYQDLFEHAPNPIWVEDFSGVRILFEDYRRDGVQDFRAFFDTHPEELHRCASAVRILEISASSVPFFGVQAKEDIPNHLPTFFTADSWPIYREEMATLAEGGTRFQRELPIHGLRGERRVISLHLSVSPGFEASLGRVLVSFTDVTQRVDMETRLQESHECLEQAQRIAHLGSWEWDLAKDTPSWSPQMFELLRLPAGGEAPTYDQFVARVHPEDRPRLLGAVEEVIASGTPLNLEFRIHRTDGSLRHVWERAELVLDDLDRPFRLRGTFQDVTEDRLLQDQVRSSEARMAAVLESTEDILVSRDLEGRCVYYNRAFARIVSELFQVEARPGMRTLDHLPEAARSHWMEVFTRVHGGGSHREEFSWRFGNGETRHYEITITPTWQEGRIIGSLEINHDITERKRMELALRDSETRFSALVESAPVGIYVTDTRGRCEYVNARWRRMAGLTQEEALGDGWQAGLHPEDCLKINEAWSRMVAAKGSWGLEYRFVDRQGSVTWVYGYATPLVDSLGRETGYLGINVDVTERRLAEAALRESEGRLSQAARATGFGVYQWDFEMGDYYFSPELLRLYGLEPGQAIALDEDAVPRAVHPEDKPDYLSRRRDALDPEGEGALDMEFRITRPDGAVRWLRVVGRTTFREGLPVQAHGTTQDITARKEAELALRKAQADLDRFFTFLPDPACVATTDGRFTRLNPVWERLLGQPEHELLAQPYQAWVHPQDWTATRQVMARQAAGEGIAGFTNRYRTPEGSYRWLEWNSSPPLEGEVFAVARDITERRRLEDTLKDLEKVSAKGQMAAYIAHEINNPLAGIKNAFALVERAISADHPYAKYADLIKREIDRIAGIIRTMYHVYRPPTLDVKAISLQQAFRDIGDLVESKCRAADVHLRIDMEDAKTTVFMNEGLLRQVLFNLVLNAIDASPAGSTITLGSCTVEGSCVILVEDEGSGIPAELADRVFEPGFTTKRESSMSGLGLGLATCRSILESLGGSLTFRIPASARGTRFEALVPRGNGPEEGRSVQP